MSFDVSLDMRTLIIIITLLQLSHADGVWVPKANAAKEGDEPAYGSKTYALADLLFEVPKTSSGYVPQDASIKSVTCKLLGEYKGRKIVQVNAALADRGYSELLLILCGDKNGYMVVLASFQSRAAQYYDILSAKNVGEEFVIQTQYNIPGTDPYSSKGNLTIKEESGNLVLR